MPDFLNPTIQIELRRLQIELRRLQIELRRLQIELRRLQIELRRLQTGGGQSLGSSWQASGDCRPEWRHRDDAGRQQEKRKTGARSR